jgi:hypothetical protein
MEENEPLVPISRGPPGRIEEDPVIDRNGRAPNLPANPTPPATPSTSVDSIRPLDRAPLRREARR